jgi:outer membrane cobalamin receptor
MKYPVVAAPRHKAHLGIGFNKGRLAINSSVQYIDGLITQTSPLLAEHNIVLWNAGVDLRVFKCGTIFVRLDNLLAQNYQINAGYPMPRTTFKAGVKFKF